ncbi:LysM peptidoglycan-binding domain-containing protein [Psychromonas sp. MME2]
MKFYCLFFAVLFLSACQTTQNSNIASESNTSTLSDRNEELAEKQMQDIEFEEGLSHLTENVQVLNEEENNAANYKNIWRKLANGFQFEVPDNSRIAEQRDYYLKHPNYLKQVSKRAEPFLYLIVEQIEANNLPLDLALLPVVESTFDPFAYSPSRASGLWQFMPITGERFGLQQDWWYDGRRDVYASTDAALSYMEFLYNFLDNDWLHALAAYNSGEGRVRNAVRSNQRKNKATDYWQLSLPRETENYVPKLLALVDILRNHEKYGVELPFIANQQVLSYVDTGSQLDLAYAAELAELSVAEIQLLNPAFNHWATSPDGPHKLLIPTVIEEQFNEQLSAIDKSKRIQWQRYKVRKGDSLSVIAKNHATTQRVLKQINNLDSSFIKIGQALLIPVSSAQEGDYIYTQAQRFAREKNKSRQGKRKVEHTVVEGDTLWDISRRYNVTTKEIAQWNKISSTKTLRLGKQLTIWQTAVAATKSKKTNKTTRSITYKVRSGDSLHAIAMKFNVSTSDLVRWNQLANKKYIHPGQSLKVYVDVLKSST